MHSGALMAARQALGQYLAYARGWQRALIGAGVIAGGALLIAAGIATGHIVMAVVGGVILLAASNACVHVARARRGRRRPGPENDAENDPENDTAER
jgi:hypothetical protein